MKVNSLEIENYRNIENINIEPCDTVNIIYGENAQGKTNLLEALWLFTGCRPFRGSKEKELVNFDKYFAKLTMSFSDEAREHEAKIILSEKKKAVFDGVEYASTRAFFGEFPGIVFAHASQRRERRADHSAQSISRRKFIRRLDEPVGGDVSMDEFPRASRQHFIRRL